MRRPNLVSLLQPLHSLLGLLPGLALLLLDGSRCVGDDLFSLIGSQLAGNCGIQPCRDNLMLMVLGQVRCMILDPLREQIHLRETLLTVSEHK